MTHSVEVVLSDGTKNPTKGYTTTTEHTSGRVELDSNGKPIVIDTFDLFRGAEDVATCVTFPDTLLHPLGKRAEHFDKAPLFMITLYKSGEMVPIGVPDKSNPTAPPIGIYVTRL